MLAFVPGLQPSYFKPSLGEKTPREHIYNHGPILTMPALNLALSKSELSKKYQPLFSSQQKPRLISCWACHPTLSQQQRTQRRRGREREKVFCLFINSRLNRAGFQISNLSKNFFFHHHQPKFFFPVALIPISEGCAKVVPENKIFLTPCSDNTYIS